MLLLELPEHSLVTWRQSRATFAARPFAARRQQLQIVIADDRATAELEHAVDHAPAVGTFGDQVTDENELILPHERDALEQPIELGRTAVDVADHDGTSHQRNVMCEKCLSIRRSNGGAKPRRSAPRSLRPNPAQVGL